MQLVAQLAARKQLLQTIGISAAAFLVALPIGGAFLASNSPLEAAGANSVTSGVCEVPATGTGTSGVTTSGTGTGTRFGNVNQSVNDHGATAQVGGNGVAIATNVGDVTVGDINVANVTTGDVLSNNSAPIGLGTGADAVLNSILGL